MCSYFKKRYSPRIRYKGKERKGKKVAHGGPKKKEKKMPVAGRDSASRARAHLGHARRYSELGQMEKAMAHLGRGLAYGKDSKAGRSSFGANTAGMRYLRGLVSAMLKSRLPNLAGLGVSDALIQDATLDELCGLSLRELSPGYDAAALIAAALFGAVEADEADRRAVVDTTGLKRQKLTGHFSVKGTKLDQHEEQKRIIGDIISGTRVLKGADFGEIKEIFVFTDVSLKATGGKLVGDIDDKFALCLLAHAARDSKLVRIVVVISARKKSDTDATEPSDVVDLFTEKFLSFDGHRQTQTAKTSSDTTHVSVEYIFVSGNWSPLKLEVCYDHGVSHLPARSKCTAVTEFDATMKPGETNGRKNLAVAVVIGPISEHTAGILNTGSEDGSYALVVGVSATTRGGVNAGGSQSDTQKTQYKGDAWTAACCGGLQLEKQRMFELQPEDTRKLLMTHAFLAKHNMESVVEIKQAHASVWRNHLGFYAGPDPVYAFRLIASNGQTTSAHGPEKAATIMSDVFKSALENAPQWPNENAYFELTRMGEKEAQTKPVYLAMAKRYVAWCFVNLGAVLGVDQPGLPIPADAASTKAALDGIDVARVVSDIAKSTKSTKSTKSAEIVKQVVLSICGDMGGAYTFEGNVADVSALYVTSVVATYMRLLSTELVLNKIELVDKIEWVGIIGAKTNEGLYQMSAKIVGVAAV